MRKVDKTIDSFVESKVATSKNVSTGQQSLPENAEINLDEFPLLTLDELKRMEKKLKKDNTYRCKIVRTVIKNYMQYFILK